MQAKQRNGYTLIEMTIVVLLISILAAAAAPRYIEATARFRVDAAARRIVADLSHVRGRAIMKGPVAEEQVNFFPATDKYTMSNAPDINRSADEYWVNLTTCAYPVDLVSASFTNTLGFTSNSTIKFDMYGYPRTGSSPSAPLTSGQIVVASGGEQRSIVVDPVTGKASIQ